MTTVKGLQQRIVKALDKGQDPAPLLKELAELRAKIAKEAETELAELQKVASERQAIRGKREAVKAKVQKQGEGIDAFLKARDTLVSQLKPLLEPMGELVKMGAVTLDYQGREPGPCYIFSSKSQFGGAVNQIPEGYLPRDFGCPFLQIEGGKVDCREKAAEANKFLNNAHSILAAFTKGIITRPLRQPAEGLVVLDDEPEGETAEVESSCLVCRHREREAIDKALQDGRSLRDIKAEFGVSRSSLSRHKAHLA